MVKTRRQTACLEIKQEEDEEKYDHKRLLREINDSDAKNTKRKLVSIPKLSKYTQGEMTTQEKVNEIIGYIVDDKLSIRAASIKAKVNMKTASKYYRRYLADPDHKIPKPYGLPRVAKLKPIRYFSDKEIKSFINDIVKNKMSRSAAAARANMSYHTATKYYLKYFSDPDRKMPKQNKCDRLSHKYCTTEQLQELFRYIEEDKMPVSEASIKANIGLSSAYHYYNKYIQDPERKIPTLNRGSNGGGKLPTKNQIKALIGYIVNDKLSIRAASVKANLSNSSGGKYYNIYLNDPDHNIPTPSKRNRSTTYTQGQIKSLINYIERDKMSLRDASRKADIAEQTARRYHLLYLTDPEHKIPMPRNATKRTISQEDVKKVIGYIVDDQMSISVASAKVNMSEHNAGVFYNKYLENFKIPDHKMRIPRR